MRPASLLRLCAALLHLAPPTAAFMAASVPAAPSRSGGRSSVRPAAPPHASAAALGGIGDVDLSDVGFIVLAGGTGSRMQASMPKQFLELAGVPVLHHSLRLVLEELPAMFGRHADEPPPYCVLVLDPRYQPEYAPLLQRYPGRVAFASPGAERQGSVENGLRQLVELGAGTCRYAAVHDSARPLVTPAEVGAVVRDAKATGAAVLGVPCKATIKESADGQTVLRTIPRARLWEVHTPQVVRIDTLRRGFARVAAENLEVTDDVSIVEALGEPVKLTRGEYTNLKITTPEDMDVAAAILRDRGTRVVDMLHPQRRPGAATLSAAATAFPGAAATAFPGAATTGNPGKDTKPTRNWYEGTKSSMNSDAMQKIDISNF